MEKKKLDWKKIVIKLILTGILIGGLVIGFYFLFKHLGWTSLTREELQDKITSTGIWAPLVFILVSFLQVTFIPIPSTITILAGNYIFGPWLDFLYSYIGIIIGSILAFYLGRLIGRPFVNWVIGDASAVDEYLKRMKNKEKVVLFFMFLLPLFPDDAICSLAGILPISFLSFFIMQVVTRATSIGGTLLFMSGEVIPYNGWGLVVIIFVCVLAIIAFIYSFKNAEKINDAFYKIIDKIFYKKNK